MSARDLKPENRHKWLAYFAQVAAQNARCHADMPPCEHGHPRCAVVWRGTCGAQVVGAYDRFTYRGVLVEVRWTLDGWQHRINDDDDPDAWVGSGTWFSRRQCESDAGERIDLANT